MRTYAECEVFTTTELELHRRAVAMTRDVQAKIGGEWVRCHELARAVAAQLGIQERVQDGTFGFVEHTWIWALPPRDLELHWCLPNVLDVYTPGAVPPVQLVNVATGLPHRYHPGKRRDDIDEDMYRRLREIVALGDLRGEIR